jgi:methionyl-tRNA formyltransferase
MRVLFWGTPAFATPPLRALLGEGFEVVAVVTQPDRPVGRSRSNAKASPVKEIALTEGVPVIQPEKPRGAEFMAQLREFQPDLSVVVAYGHILPAEVIALPTGGTLNIHASLLPTLRGAAPIEAAIREGHIRTGVSIMRMVQRLDAGPVMLQLETDIPDDETGGELTLRLSELGATALIEALALLEMGKAQERSQDESAVTYAPKIERESARIDWSHDATTVSRAVRAYDPRPGAFTSLDGKDVKLFGARVERSAPAASAGEVMTVAEDGMVVACGSGAVRLQEVQPSGQKRMAVGEWLRGRGVSPGRRFR